jgi:hypothetical protein
MVMERQPSKKLHLKKESVRLLGTLELVMANGGQRMDNIPTVPTTGQPSQNLSLCVTACATCTGCAGYCPYD